MKEFPAHLADQHEENATGRRNMAHHLWNMMRHVWKAARHVREATRRLRNTARHVREVTTSPLEYGASCLRGDHIAFGTRLVMFTR